MGFMLAHRWEASGQKSGRLLGINQEADWRRAFCLSLQSFFLPFITALQSWLRGPFLHSSYTAITPVTSLWSCWQTPVPRCPLTLSEEEEGRAATSQAAQTLIWSRAGSSMSALN